ncbi:fasciclin domain-containing protein [Sphingomonas humi]|uniref:FAS1 domain-containing protein n=1 Tax=Sphingomonas humi TaxID=335630 RepID=A0ABP7RL98_9SPHN
MRRLLLTGAAALLLASCGQGTTDNQAAAGNDSETNAGVTPGAPSQNLSALLGATPRLGQLVKAAGMEKVFDGKAPYTVLAPTDAALDKLPAGSFDGLDKPERKAEVTALLRGHILPGTILAADLERAVESGKGKATIATMTGEPLTITRDGDGLKVTGKNGQSARIVGTEQPASNGVVHTIDTVLAPAG